MTRRSTPWSGAGRAGHRGQEPSGTWRGFGPVSRAETSHAPQDPAAASRPEGGAPARPYPSDPPPPSPATVEHSAVPWTEQVEAHVAPRVGGQDGRHPRLASPRDLRAPRTFRARAAVWGELLRLPALFTVPGDALAGAAAAGVRPNSGTALAASASLCLYAAGMALNDWADQETDAVERPSRPLPSGRIRPVSALAAAGCLTVSGIAVAARAGRGAAVTATALAGTVWAYDLCLKESSAGPAAMATARSLDLLLGAVASLSPLAGHARGTAAFLRHAPLVRGSSGPAGLAAGGRHRPGGPAHQHHGSPARALTSAWQSAAILGSHTLATTTVSRHEAFGGSSSAPLAGLVTTASISAFLGSRASRGFRTHRSRLMEGRAHGTGPRSWSAATAPRTPSPGARAFAMGTSVLYAATAGRPGAHAALNPSPQLTRRAVSGGIRAMIPLQAALALRHGAVGTALALLGLAPMARLLSRRISPT
ncbi:SCO3242 family prenyltransferase [Streptomyces sp. NPDC048639]|uniref:SCO3242 family prenyltransferase n=1 Tax=Streptomyces sp. NPDC048639 TaxID=3365581 RepID=UPI00371D3038